MLAMFSSCASGSAASGWAGVTMYDGNLFTVSSRGQLNIISIADLTSEAIVPIEESGGSGGLGCAPASVEISIYGTPAVAGNMVYMAGYNGKIYAYNSTTGQLESKVLDQDNNQTIVGGPLVSDGKLYIASSNGYVYSLYANNLELDWKFKTDGKIWSTPVLSNGTLFIGSFDKKIYAIDAVTGVEKWSKSIGGAMMATPVVSGGVVYAVSLDRHIYAFDEISGEQRWQYPVVDQSGKSPTEWFWSTPVLLNGFLYAPCMDGMVYAVDIANPTNVKVFDLGSSIPSSPVVSNGKVVAVTDKGRVYTLDATIGINGEQRLIKDLRDVDKQPSLVVHSKLCAADGIVYIHSLYPDIIYAVNIESETLRRFALEAVSINTTTTVTVTETETKTVTE